MLPITIISSYARDTLIRKDNNGVAHETRFSGPAHYLGKAFRENAFPHILIVGKQLQTEIEITPGCSERGRVCGEDLSQPLPSILTPNVLISSVWKEWDVSSLREYAGRVFLDVQGFIRNSAGGMGVKQEWRAVREIADRLFCLKATERELNYLPPETVAEQKAKRCLIVTKGGNGSEIFYQCRHFAFAVTPIDDLPDTLGAGDTYFANFVMSFLSTGDIERTGRQATEKAAQFLRQKKELHNED